MQDFVLRISSDKKKIFALFLVFGLLVFSSGLPGDFVKDDIPIIRDRPTLRSFSGILSELWQPYNFQEKGSGIYRPVTMISYGLNHYFLAGSSLGFHLINILLHIVNSFLVFLIIFRWSGRKILALLSALFFLVLPIHIEAVTGLVGRAELLSFFFGFCFLLVFSRGKPDLISGGALLLLALLSKETAIAFPVIYLFWLVYREKRLEIKVYKKYLPQLFAVVAAVFLFFVLRVLVLWPHLFGSTATIVENPLKFLPWWQRILTSFKILFLYIFKSFIPVSLSSDYSYNQIRAVSGLFDWQMWLGVAAMAMLLYLLVFRFKKFFLSFSSMIFLAGFLPVSNIFFPIGAIMGERLMYLPSFGLMVLLSGVVLKFWKFFRRPLVKNLIISAVLLLFAFYSFSAFKGNFVWHSEKSLYLTAAKNSPDSVQARSNLGAMYILEGKYDLAEEELKRAIEIYPHYPEAMNNMGLVFRHKKEYQKAEEILRDLVSRYPGYTRGWENLSLILSEQGKISSANVLE